MLEVFPERNDVLFE